MQKQHHHLHTQEKILRYELAQKRKLLTELKEELEYCREKWLQAREKNSTTEAQWKQLRTEFASRKTVVNDDYNNSLESGYSDERESSSTDEEVEPGYETETDISESHNKISSPEPVSEEVLETDNTHKATEAILDVVLEGITEIESAQEVAQHSAMQVEKTDLVQSEEIEKTEVAVEEHLTAGASTSTAAEDRVSSREERLKRLEEETRLLMKKVSKTTLKSWQLDVKVENLHERYGDGTAMQDDDDSSESEDDDV